MKPEQRAERVTEGLKAIYGDQSDDLHVVEKGKTRLQRWVAGLVKVSILACVVVAVVAAIVLRQTWFAPIDPSVQVSAVWEGELVTGQTATLDIRYANPLRRPLADLSLDINLPPGFRVTEALPAPTDEENMVWHVGTLGRSSDGRIRVTGMIEASPSSVFPAQIVTTFRPSNFNADFSQVTNIQAEIAKSIYTLESAPVTSVVPGEVVTYTLTVKGPEGAPAGTENHPLLVELQPPASFSLQKTVPEALTDGAPRIPVVLTGGQAVVQVSGTYTADASGTQQWTAFLREETVQGGVQHAESTWATDVRTDGIAVTIVGNGDQVSTETSRGKTLRLTVRIKNTSQQPLRAQSVLLDFQPGSGVPIAWASATLDGGTVTREGVRYTVNADLAPGEERVFNPSFPLRADVRAGDQDTFTIVAQLTMAERTTTTAPFTVRVIDIPALTLDTESVAGPLPPQVGQGTTYAVTVTVPATTTDLESLELTGSLPAGVTFGGLTAGGWTPTYNQSTRSLQLVATNKAGASTLSATFTLVAIPGSADVGTLLPLWRDLMFRGKETKTGALFAVPWGVLTVDGPEN